MNKKYPHTDYMKFALQLAERGRCTVSPNPMVGCVIVNQGEVVGEGFHLQAGGAHAEVMALQQAGEKAKDATAYVTLEPCCHFGRTPPCSNALIKAGIAKVYVACLDPNPLVAGKGIQQLKDAGIEVEIGLLEKEAITLNEIFFHYIQNKKPFVIAKWAMSLDGKTVTHENDSRDISCKKSQEFSHQIREQVDAILIGANTVVRDNPFLTVRHSDHVVSKQPLRIILVGKNKLPMDLNVFDTLVAKTLVVMTEDREWADQLHEKNVEILVLQKNVNGWVDLNVLLMKLGERGITSLLVEGGMTVVNEFFNQGLVNKINVYLAPVIIGALRKKQPVINVNVENLHSDFLITGDYNV